MKTIFIFVFTFIISIGHCQTSDNKFPMDTLNNLVYSTYPKTNDSVIKMLDSEHPNRSKVKFDKLKKSERDALVFGAIRSFTNKLKELIDSEKKEQLSNNYSLFMTYYFNEQGQLTHLIYEWKDDKNYENESLNQKFIELASRFDFSEMPKGKAFSQCSTFVHGEKKKNKRKKNKV